MKFARLTFGLVIVVLLMATNGFAQKAPTVESDKSGRAHPGQEISLDATTALEKTMAEKSFSLFMQALMGQDASEVEMMLIEEAARIQGVDPKELRKISFHVCGTRYCVWITLGKKNELATVETATIKETAEMEGVDPDDLQRWSIHLCGKKNCFWIGGGPRGDEPRGRDDARVDNTRPGGDLDIK